MFAVPTLFASRMWAPRYWGYLATAPMPQPFKAFWARMSNQVVDIDGNRRS